MTHGPNHLLENLQSKGITLPIIGGVSLLTAGVLGTAIWFFFLRKRGRKITVIT